jgi:hypothetical protein
MAIKRETTLEPPQPRNIQRADMAPSEGFALVVDGRLKTSYEDEAAAKKAAADLLSRFPSSTCKSTMRRRRRDRMFDLCSSAASLQRPAIAH